MKNEIILPELKALDVLRYYVNYKDQEEAVVHACRVKSSNRKELFLNYKNKYMRVGRNFESNVKSEELLELAESVHEKHQNETDMVKAVEALSELFKDSHSKSHHNSIVASSKFLWLFNHETIIMDNLNQEFLFAKDYREYVKMFNYHFTKKKPEIDTIIKSRHIIEIDSIFEDEWFKKRVFDQYLWTLALSKQRWEHNMNSEYE